MESWFKGLFRIPFTKFWIAKDLKKFRFLLCEEVHDKSVGKYLRVI